MMTKMNRMLYFDLNIKLVVGSENRNRKRQKISALFIAIINKHVHESKKVFCYFN